VWPDMAPWPPAAPPPGRTMRSVLGDRQAARRGACAPLAARVQSSSCASSRVKTRTLRARSLLAGHGGFRGTIERSLLLTNREGRRREVWDLELRRRLKVQELAWGLWHSSEPLTRAELDSVVAAKESLSPFWGPFETVAALVAAVKTLASSPTWPQRAWVLKIVQLERHKGLSQISRTHLAAAVGSSLGGSPAIEGAGDRVEYAIVELGRCFYFGRVAWTRSNVPVGQSWSTSGKPFTFDSGTESELAAGLISLV